VASRQRILAHPQDWHCIIFHFLCLAAYACAFWLYQHPTLVGVTGWWSRTAFVAASAAMLGWISGIDVGVNFHNHSHRPIFISHFVNRWFGRLWTFSGGWPSFFWEYCHVTVHHIATACRGGAFHSPNDVLRVAINTHNSSLVPTGSAASRDITNPGSDVEITHSRANTGGAERRL
jgi:hypothetical protein